MPVPLVRPRNALQLVPDLAQKQRRALEAPAGPFSYCFECGRLSHRSAFKFSVLRSQFQVLSSNFPKAWQARRESNPQPPVLETGALPIELLAYSITVGARGSGPDVCFAS